MKSLQNVTPKISIIIPVYNTEEYLHQCLDSVIDQTFKDIEIICVDDGSTDNSFSILKEYEQKDSRIIVKQQENKGAAVARNWGIDISCGKYLMFLDSDDFFETTFVQELYEAAEKNSSDMVVCSAKVVDNEGNLKKQLSPYWPVNYDLTPIGKVFSADEFSKNLFQLFCVIPWNKIYSAELIKNNNIRFSNYSAFNDVCFGYKVRTFAKRMFVIDKKLAYYRYYRAGNISEKRTKNLINLIDCAVEMRNFLKDKGLYEKLKDTYILEFTNSFKHRLKQVDDEQFEILFDSLKKLMPDDWKDFIKAWKPRKITIDKIYKIIGNKKVFLWGASLYLEELLKSETEKSNNILGVIDKNPEKNGMFIGNYQIYSPDVLKKQKDVWVLLTVFHKNEIIYKQLQEDYPSLNLLPNMFEDLAND